MHQYPSLHIFCGHGNWVSFPQSSLRHGLLEELGTCCTYHYHQVSIRSSHFCIGGNKCKYLWFVSYLGPLEVNMGAFFLRCGGLHSPFCAIHKKGSRLALEKHFKWIARPFLLENYFLHGFNSHCVCLKHCAHLRVNAWLLPT